MTEQNISTLIRRAMEARMNSYSPYSGYMVGAALLCDKDVIIGGCNVENAAFSPTNCAERTAFFKAVSEGIKDFRAIAIVGGHRDAEELDFAHPCGVCRQVMQEFCDADTFQIIVAKNESEYQIYKLRELLPYGFGPDNLKGDL